MNETTNAAPGMVCRVSGEGVLASYGGLTLLCGESSAERTGALLDAVAGAADGRQLSRRLAGLISSAPDEFPALCAFGPAGAGLATLVHGDGELTVTLDGQQVHLTGRDAATLIDRVIPGPVEAVHASIRPSAVDVRPWPSCDDFPSSPAVDPPADPPAATQPARVLGVYCKENHFNDPEVAYCSVCGISMAQSARTPDWGPRPQLGVLVLDDGTTYPLVRDYVFGRTPGSDPAAEPVALDDPYVSRVHTRIVLRDWAVTVADAGSANGTFLLSQGESSWTRLTPGEHVTLSPGATIAIGRRQLRYYSHRNQ